MMTHNFNLDLTLDRVRAALYHEDIAGAISILEQLKQTEQIQVMDSLGTRDQADLIAEMLPQNAADLVSELDPEHAAEIVAELHPLEQAVIVAELTPQDSAEIVAELEPQEQADLIEQLKPDEAADIVAELTDEAQAQIAGRLSDQKLSAVLDAMEPDDAADVLGDLDQNRQQRVLDAMTEADDVRSLLLYPDESAGGLMTTSFITLRPNMIAQDAIKVLRDWNRNDELPYYLFVVDAERHLKGVVGLRPLITAQVSKPIHELMNPNVISVPVGTDQEECARLIKKYGFLALPVVDADHRILGVITNDDLMDVAEEEAVEDTFRLSGVIDEENVFSPLGTSMRKRLPWLVINLATAFLAAWVASLFEGIVRQVTVLAFLQSIAAGQGGNAATQRIAIVVRGLATAELDWKDTPRLLGKEVGLGVLQGLVIALLVGGGILLWQRNIALAFVMGLAMIGNMVVASLVGAFIPILLHRLKLDPALASAVIVTTFTDCCGFAFTLGFAGLALRWLQ